MSDVILVDAYIESDKKKKKILKLFPIYICRIAFDFQHFVVNKMLEVVNNQSLSSSVQPKIQYFFIAYLFPLLLVC